MQVDLIIYNRAFMLFTVRIAIFALLFRIEGVKAVVYGFFYKNMYEILEREGFYASPFISNIVMRCKQVIIMASKLANSMRLDSICFALGCK